MTIFTQIRLFLQVGAVISLISCTTVAPSIGAIKNGHIQNLADMGVKDMRSEFRNAFCARLSSLDDCSGILLRLPGEHIRTSKVSPAIPKAARPDASTSLSGRFRIAFVPGLLAGCGGSIIMPFADTLVALQAKGFDARILEIEGRGSNEHNGDLIARQLNDAIPDPRPWIVFGYSKGLPDVLEAIVRNPEIPHNIAAVVSYAGAVGGSQLVEETSSFPMTILEHVPLPGCDQGDGSIIHSLRRDVRQAWWQAHQMKLQMPFYSIVATAKADRVSYPLRKSYADLSRTNALNDGQLIAADALVPGSALLGYVNADHWAIAIPLSEQISIVGALFIDDVPRADLVLAAIEVISHHSYMTHEQYHRPSYKTIEK